MGRRQKPVTEYSQCRSCGADILWAKWPTSGKSMPVDAVPDMRPPDKGGGGLVLTLHGGEYGKLLLEKFDVARHDAKRNRYTSHFQTCPDAKTHRRAP